MRKSVGQARTAGKQTQQKLCHASSDIGAELEKKSNCRTRSDVGSERVNQKNDTGETTKFQKLVLSDKN
jgi:hypothetical protein